MGKYLITWGWFLFTYPPIAAQTPYREPVAVVINQLIERLSDAENQTTDINDLQEQLLYLHHNKIPLNSSDRMLWNQLGFLTEQEIAALFKHRERYGNLISIYELQAVEGLSERSVYLLPYFVSDNPLFLNDHTPFQDMVTQGKHEWLTLLDQDLEIRKGYQSIQAEEPDYAGSPLRILTRYRFTYSNRLYWGYTGEKDPGEALFGNTSPYGFDFNSFHWFYRPDSRYIKTIALGDYHVRFGQGLTCSSSSGARKSAWVMQTARVDPELRPYRSVHEQQFLRGMATTLQFEKWRLTPFVSGKYLSSEVSDTGTLESFYSMGLYRTDNEQRKKKSVWETLGGANLTWQYKQTQIGLTHVHTQYDHQLLASEKPYQIFRFSGNRLSNTGLHLSLPLKYFIVLGEWALSSNQAQAFTIHLQAPLASQLDLCVVYRHFDRDYQVAYAQPFAAYSDHRNETGMYTGLRWSLNRKWTWSSYLDRYQAPWLRYGINSPSYATDVLSDLSYQPNKLTTFTFRIRNQQSRQEGNTATRTAYRLYALYGISDCWSGKSGVDWVSYQSTQPVTGSLLFQELRYVTLNRKTGITLRYVIFSSEDYTSRLYALEPDVLYQSALPMYHNSGYRYFLLLHQRISRNVDFWIKYAQTVYSGVATISSGNEHIEGNRLREIRFQVRVSF